MQEAGKLIQLDLNSTNQHQVVSNDLTFAALIAFIRNSGMTSSARQLAWQASHPIQEFLMKAADGSRNIESK